MFYFLGRYSRPISYIFPYFLGLVYWTNVPFFFILSWATIRVQLLFLISLILGCYTGPCFRCFLENVPCSLLSGSMQCLFSPTSASPLGLVRSSLFLFYTSYLPIHLLIIILYRKIYVITVIKVVQNGILNGKREKNQED